MQFRIAEWWGIRGRHHMAQGCMQVIGCSMASNCLEYVDQTWGSRNLGIEISTNREEAGVGSTNRDMAKHIGTKRRLRRSDLG